MRAPWIVTIAICSLSACGPGVFSAPAPQTELHVAAAANLSVIFDSLAKAEQRRTGVRLIPSFGSTAQLTKQIEAGAPFDLFLAADSDHPTELVKEGLAAGQREYARGRVVIWAPKRKDIHTLEDLVRDDVKVVAIANPDLAPYGKAAVEALKSSNLWSRVQPRVVYAQNISAALNYADTGNADVALTAFSLVAAKNAHPDLVPADLHRPIIQSLCTLNRTSQRSEAAKVAEFFVGKEAGQIFEKNGYSTPGR